MKLTKFLELKILLILLISFTSIKSAFGQMEKAAGSTFNLSYFQKSALENNPALKQAKLRINFTQGKLNQVGLYPNPEIGYDLEKVDFGTAGDIYDHLLTLQQDIVLSKRIGNAENVFKQELLQANLAYQAQKQALINSINSAFYETLGAQKLIELNQKLYEISKTAVGISNQLYNVGEADEPDVLEAEVEEQKSKIDLDKSINEFNASWIKLLSIAGIDTMKQQQLSGDFLFDSTLINKDSLLTKLLNNNPLIKIAQSEIDRAGYNYNLAHSIALPDLTVKLGGGYSYQKLPFKNPLGFDFSFGLQMPIPIFNHNQGNIMAAEVQTEIAKEDLNRTKLLLQNRFGSVYKNYKNAFDAVKNYKENILTKAEKAYKLYLNSFQQMAASYPQVLIAQRNYFQLNTEYIKSLIILKQNETILKGLLLTGGLEKFKLDNNGMHSIKMSNN